MTDILNLDRTLVCWSYSTAAHNGGTKMFHIYGMPFAKGGHTLCGTKITEYWGVTSIDKPPLQSTDCQKCRTTLERLIEESEEEYAEE